MEFWQNLSLDNLREYIKGIGWVEEEWKDIFGYEGLYMVSNFGRIKSLKRMVERGKIGAKPIAEKIKSQSVHYKNRYLSVMLNKGSVETRKLVHRLVGDAFLPNIRNKRTINHNNGNVHYNVYHNLQWMTDSENQSHSYNVLKRVRTWNGRGSNFKKSIRCINNNKIYDSLTSASKELNISPSGICSVLKGFKNKIKGLSFEYYP